MNPTSTGSDFLRNLHIGEIQWSPNGYFITRTGVDKFVTSIDGKINYGFNNTYLGFPYIINGELHASVELHCGESYDFMGNTLTYFDDNRALLVSVLRNNMKYAYLMAEQEILRNIEDNIAYKYPILEGENIIKIFEYITSGASTIWSGLPDLGASTHAKALAPMVLQPET